MSPVEQERAAHRAGLTNWLILKYTSQKDPHAAVSDPEIRTQYAYLEAWISIIGNFFLSIIKIALGLLLNSISLLADAAHTAADVLTSVVVLVGFKFAKAPADEKHPFGHGRVEFISSLAISILLLTVGVEFGKSSYERLIDGTAVKGSIAVALIMIVGGLFKEWMTRFATFLGIKASAQALIGDAWHHRTDAIASVLVAVAIIASRFGHYWVDAVLGFGVSVLILWTGFQLAQAAVSSLIGEKAPPDVMNAIEEAAMSCDGVIGLHNVVVHDYGNRKAISLHILVSGDLTVSRSHEIASDVEEKLKSRIPADIVVHTEPEQEGLAS